MDLYLLGARAWLGDEAALPLLLGMLPEATDVWQRSYIISTFPFLETPAEQRMVVTLMNQGEPVLGDDGKPASVPLLVLRGQQPLIPASALARAGVKVALAPGGGAVPIAREGRATRTWAPTPPKHFWGRTNIPHYAEPNFRVEGGEILLPVVALHPWVFGGIEWEPSANRLWLW